MTVLPSISPFDAIKLKDSTYCFAHHDFWGGAPYFARPKYVPTVRYPHDFMGHYWTYEGVQYSRLGDSETVRNYMGINPSVFYNDGYIQPEQIERVIPARITMNDFLEFTRKLDDVSLERKAAYDLINHLVEEGVNPAAIGITGSILLKGEVRGFSDFDLVLYGAEAIGKSEKILRSLSAVPNSPLYYRTKEEAKKFYHKYSVLTDLSDEEFADTFPGKVSQGIMIGIPFSIFQVPTAEEVKILSEPKKLNNIQSPEREIFEAILENDSYSKFTYKALYQVKKTENDGKIYNIFCYDRACTEQAQKGETLLIDAEKLDEKSYIVYAQAGFIKPLAKKV